MTSLADLFNPTFLMFLGILVLVVALLVVYFESKMRDQNHKIASMLSLVSTLAEDMNGVKMGLNHLAIRGGQGFQQSDINIRDNLGISQKNNLIEVSDNEETENEDEDEDNEDEDNEDEDNEDEDNEDEDNEDEDNEDKDNEDLSNVDNDSEYSDNDDIKVVKLQVSNEDIDSYEEANNLDFDITEDLGELDGDLEPEINSEYVEEVLDLKYENVENNLEESNIISSSELRTISINLGEEHQHNEDNIDYKKLQLAKLRSIAVEKGLTSNSEASKLKKPELLKLLGAE
jgi:hypothetical protein